MVHKLHQHPDGSLGVEPVESVADAFVQEAPIQWRPLSGEWQQAGAETEKDKWSCRSPYGYAALLGDSIPRQCYIKLQCSYSGHASSFGLALQVDETFSQGYYLMFEPAHQRIQFRSGLRMYEQGGQMFPYAVEMERPLVLQPDRTYSLELYIQDTIGLLYVDRDLAFGFRMYNHSGRNVGFFVSDGDASVQGASIWTE